MSRRSYKFPTQYGTGTEQDPFIIYNENDLVLMFNALNANSAYTYHEIPTNALLEGQYFLIVNDIDLSTVCSSTLGNWQVATVQFKGDLNGDNHIISNLYNVTNSSSSPSGTTNTGCFIYSNSGHVHHLQFSNVTLQGYYGAIIAYQGNANSKADHIKVISGTLTTNFRHAGIIGCMVNNGLVEHCETYSDVTITKSSSADSYGCLGGIVGRCTSGTIRYNINCANILVSTWHLGGILGSMGWQNSSSLNVNVKNNINFGTTGSGSAQMVAGIVGDQQTSQVDCNLQAGYIPSQFNHCNGVCGYIEPSGTAYTRGNLNIGPVNSTVNPISNSGTLSYNYYTKDVMNTTPSTSGKVIPLSESELVCTTNNTKPSSITDTTYFNTTNYVFKTGFYPYPKDIENEDACLCAAAPIIFSGTNTYKTISGNIELGGTAGYSAGITWTSSDSTKMRIDTITENGSNKYIGTKLGTGSVVITNYKNGRTYKRITLTLV